LTVLPNLLVAGAMRCGTTSLYRYFDAHPEIFMAASKEPQFLAYEGARPQYTGPGDERLNQRVYTELAEYETLFNGSDGARWRGEASATYLYLESTLGAIRRHELSPEVVVLLRDPADRAYSAFQYLRRQGREPLETLAAGLDAEEERRAEDWAPMWHYLRAGLYSAQLARWFEAVGREHVQVVLYEDLEQDPRATLRSLFEHLGVDPFVPIDVEVHNQSGTPRSRFVQRVTSRAGPMRRSLKRALPRRARRAFERLREKNIVRPPGLDAATRARIVAEVADDVRRTELLIGADLAAWRE
jgi:hypothetical protein